jgi:hypothetical protein
MLMQLLFWDGTQGNHQNSDPFLTGFHRHEAKKTLFEKKIKMAGSKKLSFSIPPILNTFFSKISGISPWVSRID